MIEIKHKETGKVLHTVDADTLEGADLSGLVLNHAGLHDANLMNTNLTDTELENADLTGANLSHATLSSAALSETVFYKANLHKANLMSVQFIGSNLSGANLRDANLQEASLHYAQLKDADLSGADLGYTRLTGTDMRNADFTGVELGSTVFESCDTLHLSKGLEHIEHLSDSILDFHTLRACVNYLPDIFLMGVGYESQEIDNLRAMYVEDAPQLTEEHKSITFNLNVPDTFRVPCEQYLMYFVQFLHNFGVEVDADLKHTAGEVLFTITPTDERQALEKIAEALYIYLNMSASSETSLVTMEADTGLMILRANITQLQSQLMYYQATLQNKNATIFAQQTAIENLMLRPGNTIVVPSAESKPKEDKEEVLDGLVAVKKFDLLKGLEVNLPEMYRRAKRLFIKEKD